MGRFLDKLTGTKQPLAGVEPWTFGKGGLTEDVGSGYSSQAVKSALQERVLSTGWGWRGMVFGS